MRVAQVEDYTSGRVGEKTSGYLLSYQTVDLERAVVS